MSNFYDSSRGGGSDSGAYIFTPNSAAQIPVTIQLLASQTGNALTVLNSSGTTIFAITPAGNLTLSGSVTAVVNETISGNIALTGTLSVTGATTLGTATASTLTISGVSTFNGVPTFATNVTMNGALTVAGLTSFTSTKTNVRNLFLLQTSAAPASVAAYGGLYTNAVSSITELFYIDSAGSTTQMTSAGALNGANKALSNLASVAINANLNSADAVASSITLQAQTFTSGATHNAVIISPIWTTENFAHTALSLTATQNGANTQTVTGFNIAMVKATGASTLATLVGMTIAAVSVTGTVTTNYGIQIGDQSPSGGTTAYGILIASQTANATTTRAINIAGTGKNNSIMLGGSPLLYSSGAEVIRMMDSTDARGISVTLTAAGNQTVAATGGTLTFTTPDIGVATGTSIALGGGTALANYLQATFSPTVTLVGGAGNTTPVYVTNTGRYTRIGNQVFVDVYLTGDGGAEGAGTGTFSVAIPIASNASHPTSYFPVGFFANSTAEEPIWGQIAAGGTVIDFAYEDVLNNFTVMTGAEQNNTTRTVRLKFFYEV